jgi:hypothetical protein
LLYREGDIYNHSSQVLLDTAPPGFPTASSTDNIRVLHVVTDTLIKPRHHSPGDTDSG